MTALFVAKILFAITVLVVCIHWAALFFFLRAVRIKSKSHYDRDFQPKTAVLLALRGDDPFLHRCLEGLLSQSYRNYAVRIIVDHPNDPALDVVHRFFTDRKKNNKKNTTNDIDILVVDNHLDTCALKCNSLLAALEKLDPSFEVVVTLDADTNPYPDWLGRLVAPLCDPRCAVASGMRWYAPSRNNPGTLVRYLWNAAAFVQMYLYKIPWGGSLAIKRTLFSEHGLSDRWRTSFTDDVSVSKIVDEAEMKVEYVPTIIMLNRETCRLSNFFSWVQRQMLYTKLYHRHWTSILFQCLLISLPQLMIFALIFYGIFFKETETILWATASIVLYWLGVFMALPFMEAGVRQLIRIDQPQTPSLPIRTLLAAIPMIPLTQCIYTAAVISLFFLREVDWRGIRYRILGDKSIRMLHYECFERKDALPAENDESLH